MVLKKKLFVGLKVGYGDWGSVTYGLSTDYAISNYFGIGLDVAYTSWNESGGSYFGLDTSNTNYNLTYSYNLIGLLANFSYHFNPGEKFDPYVKGGAGYFLINASEQWSPRKPSNYYSSSAKGSSVGYGGKLE